MLSAQKGLKTAASDVNTKNYSDLSTDKIQLRDAIVTIATVAIMTGFLLFDHKPVVE